MKPIIHSRYPKILLILILSTGLFSCYKDRFDVNKIEKGVVWSPDVAAPVVNTTLTLKDVLNHYDVNNQILEEPNGFLYLLYNNHIFSQKAEDLIVIVDQSINTDFDFSVTGALPFGVDLTAAPNTVNYSFTMPYNSVITELDVKSGVFNFYISSSNLNHNATIHVNIPSATLNGVPFSQDLNFNFGSTNTQQIDLTGYKILFDNTGGNQNSIAITYTVTLHGSGGANNSPYNISMGEAFAGVRFSKITGDLKQIPFDLPNDTVRIQFFNNNITGVLDFADPKVHLFA